MLSGEVLTYILVQSVLSLGWLMTLVIEGPKMSFTDKKTLNIIHSFISLALFVYLVLL